MISDVTVIGGGIIGLLSARELVQAGAKVRILDKGNIGGESSWAGGGILSPLYPWRYPPSVNTLAAWSQPRYEDICLYLKDKTGIDPQWRQTGLLVLDANRDELAPWQQDFGGQSQWLDNANDIRQIEPRLPESVSQALWMPHIAQVRNPRLLAAIRSELDANGCEIHENTDVHAITRQHGKLTGIDTSKGRISTGHAIVATGAWSGEIMASLNIELRVRPVRGQMIVFRAPADWLHRMVLHNQRYAIPRADGRILVGSTLEEVGFDKSTTEEARADLINAAEDLVPDLTQFPVETQWSGLRPGSPTGVPVISKLEAASGLVICSGHFRNGFVLGLASARLAVDLLLDRAPVVDPSPYTLESV